MKRSTLSLLLSSIVGLAGNTALAQYDSYGTTAVGTGIGVGLMILWIIFMLVGLALFVLWLWMLIDCVKRPFDKKTMWIVLIIILGWIGAIAYFFVVKRKKVGEGGGGAPPAQTTPPPPPASPPQPQG